MPVFGPTRAALAAAAARGADILPSLRLVLTAEALTAPPPPRALELNAELDALCAAVRELADCRAGWLYFCPAYAPLPAAVPRALLQGTVLTFLRGVLRSERRAAVRLAAQQGAAVLALQGGDPARMPGDLPARRAAAQPAGLQDTNKPLGVCMALAGAALLASGVAAGNTARYAILYPEVLSGSCPVWAAWADLLLPIFAGAWLLNYAVRAFSGFGLQRQRLGSSLLAGAVPLVFLWRLIWRFQFAPASLCRMPCTLRVLSAAAALLLAVVLIKIFLVPGLPCGHTLYAAGTGAFLLCTGLELPQTLFEAARGMLTLPDLLTGIGIGLFGLCGLVCAWEACGKETE